MAYINSESEQKVLVNSELHNKHWALPSTVSRHYLIATMTEPGFDKEFIHDATAVLINFVLFHGGDVGADMLSQNIVVSKQSVLVEIALRKNQSRVSYTLAYSRNNDLDTSLIHLVPRYDTMRLSV